MTVYTGTSGVDTLTGSSGDDEIYGLGDNDTLNGGDGADLLDGGTGQDTMTGGAGDDTYFVDNVFDSVVEAASEGTDLVSSSVNYALSANVENLTLTGSAVSGSGNALRNTIHGNAGDNSLFGGDEKDTLYGEGGNDTLYGGSDDVQDVLDGGTGDDIMYGGLGNDIYYVDSLSDAAVEYASEGVSDVIRSSITWTLSTTGNIESLQLQGSSNINGTGNQVSNLMNGNTGDNVLTGGAGTDTIRGGDGNDLILGGVTNDLLHGEAGYDTFAFFDESVNLPTLETDRIYDLDMANGDRIDVSAIDADVNTAGNQAFTFVAAFTGVAGQAKATYSGVFTDFDFDVDGDSVVDFRIRADGSHAGTTTDILTGSEPISDGGWFL